MGVCVRRSPRSPAGSLDGLSALPRFVKSLLLVADPLCRQARDDLGDDVGDEVLAHAGLEHRLGTSKPRERVVHFLRVPDPAHAAGESRIGVIPRMSVVGAGVSLFYLARFMGTSVEQIDRTYGHLLPDSIEHVRGLLDAWDAENQAFGHLSDTGR